MSRERQGFHVLTVYSLWQELSGHTIMVDLVILTLKFDLIFKNFNLGYKLWTVRESEKYKRTDALSLWHQQ